MMKLSKNTDGGGYGEKPLPPPTPHEIFQIERSETPLLKQGWSSLKFALESKIVK